MKLITLRTIVTFSLALLPASLSAQGYTWHSVTPDEAVQAVRNFESIPNLALKITLPTTASLSRNGEAQIVPHTESIPSQIDLLAGYSLDDGRYQYNINYYSLDEFSFVDTFNAYPDKFYGQPYDPAVLKSQVMSESSAQAIAQAYVNSHYPEPALLNKITVTPDYGSQGNDTADQRFIHSYQFNFDQDCGNGVLAPAGCFVEVDTIKGQIIIFTYTHYPVLISPIPQFTGEQAMSAAMNALNISDGVPRTVEGVGISKPDGMGQENLYYSVTFYGVHNGVAGNYIASVDGNTGELNAWDISHSIAIRPKTPVSAEFSLMRVRMAKKLGATSQTLKFMREKTPINLNYPLLGIGGRAYIYAGYLSYKAPGTKLAVQHGKQVTVNGPNRQIVFNLNSLAYQVNGQAKQMSAKPAIINGRCYVPLDVMNAVLPGKFTYDAKAQTVRYDPPQSKQASK